MPLLVVDVTDDCALTLELTLLFVPPPGMSMYRLLEPRDANDEFEARLPALLTTVFDALMPAENDDDDPATGSSGSNSLDSPTASSSSMRSSSELDRTSGAGFVEMPSVEFGVPEMIELDDAGEVLRPDVWEMGIKFDFDDRW